jgi:hypothetical protein
MSPDIPEWRADVTIAMIESPAPLKLRVDSTTAGLDFTSAESLNGKRTTTTLQASQITEILVVLGRIPFRFERLCHTLVPGGIEGSDLSNDDSKFRIPVSNIVARMYLQTLPNFTGKSGLPFARDLTSKHALPPY